MSKSPMVQTAERGAYPEVMCATEDSLEQRVLRTDWPHGNGRSGRQGDIGTVCSRKACDGQALGCVRERNWFQMALCLIKA